MIKNTPENNNESLLIVFAKNPVLGKVKSRLALNIGFYNAYLVYKELLKATHKSVRNVDVDKQVCYSDFIDQNDIWENENYSKEKQIGKNIGIRMRNAFADAFNNGFKKVILIGSDIINLDSDIINEAIDLLDKSEIVFGPAKDGGYYLIGMKSMHEELFKDISWSTKEVFIQSLKKCLDLDLKVKIVKELSDLDRVQDFQYLNNKDRQKYFELIRMDDDEKMSSIDELIKKGA